MLVAYRTREAALIRGTAARLVAACAAANLELPVEKRHQLLLPDAEEALCCVITNGLEARTDCLLQIPVAHER